MPRQRPSLAELYDRLKEEWESVKNECSMPPESHLNFGRKYWWKCQQCPEVYQSSIHERMSGRGCPYCAGKRVGQYNSLAARRPDVAREWHYVLNGDGPEDVTVSSGKKRWWLCEKGHSWEATIASRTGGHKCPYCSNQKTGPDNNLEVLRPDLAAEWHPTKNGNLRAKDVTLGSNRKVWWLGKCGHEWDDMTVVQRTRQNQGCPYCAGKRVAPEDSLAHLYPYLVDQWHPTLNGDLTPWMVTPGSGLLVYWICRRGHAPWRAKVQDRAKGGTGCPNCTNQTSKIQIRLYCELRVLFHDVRYRHRTSGIECDIFIPGYQIAIEYDGIYWHKDKEDQDRQKSTKLSRMGIRDFRLREVGLSLLSERDTSVPKKPRHLATIRDLLKKLIRFGGLSGNDRAKVHNYLRENRLRAESCYNKMLSALPGPPAEESLEVKHPEVAKDWDYEENSPLTPRDIWPGDNEKYAWVCFKCGYKWRASANNRTARTSPSGCKDCTRRRRWVTEESNLGTKRPDLASLWHRQRNGKMTPRDVATWDRRKFWWQCSLGHEWRATVHSMSSGKKCPYCAGKLPTAENNLEAKFPEIAKDWHKTKNGELLPSEVLPFSHKAVWWLCASGHERPQRIADRNKRGGCPDCKKQKRGVTRKCY